MRFADCFHFSPGEWITLAHIDNPKLSLTKNPPKFVAFRATASRSVPNTIILIHKCDNNDNYPKDVVLFT